ncbi:MAG: hypothetical protein IRZ05_17570, partial [Micromonosporaceae bacterium]|nr:hypothetical protein [Micromonosporaceae bacterium]
GAQQVVPAGPTGTRTATLSEADGYVAASVYIQGPAAIAIGSTTIAGTAWNWTPGAPGDIFVVISAFSVFSLDARPAAPAAPSDTDGGGWVLLADTGDLFVADDAAGWIRLIAWAKVVRTAGVTHQITLPGADAATTVSHLARVPAADVGGDWDIRFIGEAAAWRPDRTGNFVPGSKGDAWTGVDASGLLRRLSQGTAPLLSPIRRLCTTVAVDHCAAYWPCEDGADAKQVASGLPGGNPMRIDGGGTISFAQSTVFGGSAPLLELGDDTNLHGDIPAGVDTAGAMYWRMLIRIPDDGYPDLTTLMNWYPAGGPVARIGIVYGTSFGGCIDIRLYDSFGTQLASTGFFTLTPDIGFNGVPMYLSLELVRSGSNTNWLMSMAMLQDDGTIDARLISGTFSGITVGRIYRFSIGGSGAMGGTVLGHMGIADTQQWFFGTGSTFLSGYSGETAGRRFLRICAENGIPASVLGDPDDTVPMGPQPVDTLVNVLAEIERTDAGILYEPRDQLGLVYRTRESLYNQTVALTLDWDDGRMSPLTPVLDDRYTRNDVTVSRSGGSSARAVQETGPLNVQPPSEGGDGVGRYATELLVNPASDSALPDLAAWQLHLGVVDEVRYPQLTVDLDLYTAVARNAAQVDIGDRIVVTNVPDDLSPDDIDLIVVGCTETITPTRRTITFNCVPASAYTVAVYDTDRYDATDAKLAVAATSSATSIAVSSTALWTGDDGDFDISVGGERMTVTAVSGTSSPQVFTVTRAVNGVSKAHAAGTPVRLWKTPRYAL